MPASTKKVHLKGKKLTVEFEIDGKGKDGKFPLSKSGLSRLIGSTGGNRQVQVTGDMDCTATLGFNLYIMKAENE